MTQLEKMYEGKINSPETFLRDRLVSGGNVVYLMDDSILPTLPNLLVIGKDQTAETVLVTEKRTDGGYDIQRAIQGTAKDWPQGTSCSRNFTEYDYDKLIKNIEKLNTGKQDNLTAGSNITITNNKISATDTTYTAGTNVTITGTTISAKDTIYDDTALKTRITAVEYREDKDTKYTAGTNVQISTGNVISATDTKYTAGANITIDSSNKISAAVPTIDYPVQSVNSKTGAVTITKSDVGLGAVNNVAITAAQVAKINELNYTRALTQAQYDALSTAEKNRTDVWYGIYK